MIPREPRTLFELARDGSRTALARLLTYVESGGPLQLDTAALAYEVPSPYVVGITGPPGGGKSTLTDRLITLTLDCGSFDGDDLFDQVGVLCVDPSSPSPVARSSGTEFACRTTRPTSTCSSVPWRRAVISADSRSRYRCASRARRGELPTRLGRDGGVGQMEVDIARRPTRRWW